MNSVALQELMEQADALPPDEQLQLAAYLVSKASAVLPEPPQRRRKWREIRGAAKYPMVGEDAQEWVSRTRREGTESRESQWKRDE